MVNCKTYNNFYTIESSHDDRLTVKYWLYFCSESITVFFITLNPKDFSVAYAKQIAERILARDQKNPILTDEQRQTLNAITRPMLGDHEDEIKRLCQEVVDTLVVTDPNGKILKFYRDDAQGLLYFGDEDGWRAGQALHKHPTLDPSHLNQD